MSGSSMQNLLLMSDMDAVGPHCAANFRFNRPMAERWVKFAVVFLLADCRYWP